ncbi:hypothetical protein QNI16_28830 [Cytophagaceae bacterium YF14B1]|uniref:Uncharacterized protein n=1 Tax=Xanthocytophaga flava TaxID=3048013 RepID=A0AAE3QY03_9BACT|nr:hypothetical protein [Xanthocytophaga flavus]MDJ1484538.1 hypothetical protein [Xanthocytophaga flavus]
MKKLLPVKYLYKTALVTIGLILNVGLSTYSQNVNRLESPEDRATKLTQKMTEELKLNKSQQAKVSEINQKYALIMQKEIIDTKLSRSAKFSKFKEVDTQKSQELKTVLTPAQMTNYEKLKEEIIQKIQSNG